MDTLSKGYEKPENPDTGDLYYPAMERNIQRMNDHTHNGTDGSLIALTSQNIAAASWAAAPIGGGLYVQTVTLPAAFSFDTTTIEVRLSTGEVVHPTIEKVSATQYKIYTNDNSLAYVAKYR